MKEIAHKIVLFLSIAAMVIACSKDDESTPETPKSSEKQILTFVFKATDNEAIEQDFEGTVNESDKTITITDLPFAADVTALIPTITVSDKATVDPTSGTAQNFTDDVTYTVTAEDGSEQGYTISVSLAPGSSQKQILSFVFKATDNEAIEQDFEGTVNESDKTITITDLPFGTDVTSLTPTITVSDKATVDPTSGTAQNFTDDVTYTVTAEDGSEQGYTISVSVTPGSDKKQILSFVFKATDNDAFEQDFEGVINETDKTITVTNVPFGTNVTALVPTITVSDNATVDPASGMAQSFTDAVIYTVTAEDGSEQGYAVVVSLNEISDRDVLIAIYNANPDNTLGWDITSENISSWDGVTTNNNGKVVNLSLNEKNLNTLPMEIGSLSELESIFLNFNSLTNVPIEIGNLSNLATLSLASNNLTSIPAEIGNLIDNLGYLDIRDNSLAEIPAEIGNLINLDTLVFSNNLLSDVPPQIGNLSILRDLRLDANLLSSIPIEIGNLTSLSYLNISNNQLNSIPQEICNLSNTGTTVIADPGLCRND